MAREIWNGVGEISADAAYFTKMDGTLQGRPYVRRRASSYVSARCWYIPRKFRKAALAATVDDDAWLASRNGLLVSAICRDVLEYVFQIWDPKE